MTGTIEKLSDGSTSGFIKAENGLSVQFDSSAVLAYDAARLAVGQLVTFDVENGIHPLATNICVHKQPGAVDDGKRRPENVRPPRYMGFEQMGRIRAYRFVRLSLHEETQIFFVSADLDLFTKHHIGIQEGPGLCLAVLVAEYDAASCRHQAKVRDLTDTDMLAHLAQRPVPAPRHQPRRTPRPQTTTSRSPSPWAR